MTFAPLNVQVRAVDTRWAISALRKYLTVVETQMEEVYRCECLVLNGEHPASGDEEERSLHWNRKDALDQLFKEDLMPAMRYSFVVLMHTVFETRLRAFCKDMEKDRKIPIPLADLRGSAIEQARTYLTRLAGLSTGDFPEWQQLRTLQKIRDCIVHGYGFVSESRDPEELRRLATQNIGIEIDDNGRLALTKAFCDQSLSHLDTFFERLFCLARWII
jgi:hypothetical protein